MEFLGIIIGLSVVLAGMGFRMVNQQSVYIVETLGKYNKVLGAGLHWIPFPLSRTVGKLSLKIEQIKAKVEIKTKDDVFVEMPVDMLFKVSPEMADKAYYQLKNPSAQISSWVLNCVRSAAADMDLQDLFKDKSKITSVVEEELSSRMKGYGYIIENILIDQPTVPHEVQNSFNRVISSKREAEAAEQEAKALKIKIQANAEAEGSAQTTRAKALTESRKIVAKGLKDSMDEFQGLDHELALQFLLQINEIDALRDIGKNGNLILSSMRSSGDTHPVTNASLIKLLRDLTPQTAKEH